MSVFLATRSQKRIMTLYVFYDEHFSSLFRTDSLKRKQKTHKAFRQPSYPMSRRTGRKK